jgi:AraC-like DNA-binding protein
MTRSDYKAELEFSLGRLLTEGSDGKINRTSDFGNFACSIENVSNITIVRRNFETDEPLTIPFFEETPSMQMIFSFDGQSVFNDRFSPFILSPTSHCLNFFKRYECCNLLAKSSRQHDLTFRLNKNFYSSFLATYITNNDRLPMMIVNGTDFNTINQNIQADAGVVGILKNILDCPFTGEMKTTFIREHVKALLTLQFLHFNTILTGVERRHDNRITNRDRDILHDVKAYIDQNFLNPTSIEDLSKHFALNEFKLKHGFKVLFDTSPIRYLQHKRLEFSLFLLRETDKTIKEIADEVGYNHAANFTSAFVKAFGKPPVYFKGKSVGSSSPMVPC